MDEKSIQTDDNGLDPSSTQTEIELAAKQEVMLKEIRSWGLWSLGLGIVHLISSGFLSSSWGVLLLIVGLSSFYFRTASIFVVYAVTLSWAALSNLLSFNTEWIIFSAIQGYLAFRTFQDYQRFKKTEDEIKFHFNEIAKNQQKAAKSFPWIGSVLGCSSIIGIVFLFLLSIFLAAINGLGSETPAYYTIAVGIAETFAVLGFAVSLSSFLSKHTPKALSIVGMFSGGVFMILWIILSVSNL